MSLETARIEHLKLIQAVINRMGRNSFAIKSAAAASSAALVAFMASTASPIAALAGLAILPLWVLDARFLAQERGFRRLYDFARKGPPSHYGCDSYFSMEFPSTSEGSDRFTKVMASPSLYLCYIPLLMMIGVSSLIGLF